MQILPSFEKKNENAFEMDENVIKGQNSFDIV